MRRFPHGGSNRPGHARPTVPYGQLPVRPGPGELTSLVDLSPALLRWAAATEVVVVVDEATVGARGVLDEHA